MTDPLNYWQNGSGPPFLGPAGLHAWGAALLDTAAANAAGTSVRFADHGGVPDGATDNGTALNDLITTVSAAGGGEILLNVTDAGSVYKTLSTINLKSNVTLRGDGAATLDYSEVPKVGSARYGIRATGTKGTETLLTANATKGALTAAVTSAAGLSVGQWVLVATTGGNYYPYGGGVNADRGEVKRIRAISGTTITFEVPLYDAYATANGAHLAPLNVVENIAIENLHIVGSGTANEGDRAIQFDYVDRFRVAGCTIEATDIYAVQLATAIRGDIAGNTIRGVHYDGTTGIVFYAVSVMNASQWIRVRGNHAEQVRHLFVTSANSAGQGQWGQPRFVTCTGNVAQNMMASSSGRSWAYEHHGFGDGILIEDNVADGCYGGFCARGPGVTFKNNIVRNWYQYALQVSADTVDARNIIITGNQVSARLPGATDPRLIYVDLSNATTVQNVVIDGNVCELDTAPLVEVIASATVEGGVSVSGNRFSWVGGSATATWLATIYHPRTQFNGNIFTGCRYGVRLYGAGCDACDNAAEVSAQETTGHLVYVDAADAIVTGSRSRSLQYCVRSSANGTGLTLLNNIAYSSSTDPFIAGTTTGLVAKNNVWQGGTTTVNT